MWQILLIQGANMVHLGKREPELYGKTTAEELPASVMPGTPYGIALEAPHSHTWKYT